MANKNEEEKMMGMMANRISFSVFIGCLWVVFFVWWLFFNAESYTLYQNLAVFLISLILPGAVLCIMWVNWGMRYGMKWEKIGKKFHH
jgi:hypothetical protein